MTDRTKTNQLFHIRPFHLMTVFALFLAGTGLARYLGARIDYAIFGLCLSWMMCTFLGIFLMGDHFKTPFVSPILPAQPALVSPEDQNKKLPSNLLLFGALALLSAAGVLTVLIGLAGAITPAVGLVLAACFGVSASLVLPGFNLKYSGIGEFMVSISLVVFPPALAFMAQYGEFHRFLTLSIFPLFPLHLAMILTLRLRSYPSDSRKGRKTLMVRIGWVRGIFLHNMLVLSGFLLFGAAMLFGLPFRIAGPIFITLIPAIYLIWVYSELEWGAPVRWPLIIYLAMVVFFLPVYLITFTSWVF